jgi:hypothetical protein
MNKLCGQNAQLLVVKAGVRLYIITNLPLKVTLHMVVLGALAQLHVVYLQVNSTVFD